MKEKIAISQFNCSRISQEIKHHEKQITLLRKKLNDVIVVDNCLKCNGKGEVPIGNINGVYGFRLGDNGYVGCPECEGKGYEKR